MRLMNSDEVNIVSGGNAAGEFFAGGGGYYVGSEVGAAALEGAELGSIAGPGGALIGLAVGAAAVLLWDATE